MTLHKFISKLQKFANSGHSNDEIIRLVYTNSVPSDDTPEKETVAVWIHCDDKTLDDIGIVAKRQRKEESSND